VNEIVLEALNWPDAAEDLYREIKRILVRRRQAAKKADTSSDAVKTRAEIRRCELQLQRHIDFIGKTGAKAPQRLMGEIERLERRVAALQESLVPPAKTKIEAPTEEEIRDYMSAMARALEKGNPAKRREVYRTLIRRIVISPKTTKIEGNPPWGIPGGRARWCRGRDPDGPHHPANGARRLAGMGLPCDFLGRDARQYGSGGDRRLERLLSSHPHGLRVGVRLQVEMIPMLAGRVQRPKEGDMLAGLVILPEPIDPGGEVAHSLR
jgi:hypothetical protein